MRRAGVYVRISSDPDGTALGVARQQRDCQELAEWNGWRRTPPRLPAATAAPPGCSLPPPNHPPLGRFRRLQPPQQPPDSPLAQGPPDTALTGPPGHAVGPRFRSDLTTSGRARPVTRQSPAQVHCQQAAKRVWTVGVAVARGVVGDLLAAFHPIEDCHPPYAVAVTSARSWSNDGSARRCWTTALTTWIACLLCDGVAVQCLRAMNQLFSTG